MVSRDGLHIKIIFSAASQSFEPNAFPLGTLRFFCVFARAGVPVQSNDPQSSCLISVFVQPLKCASLKDKVALRLEFWPEMFWLRPGFLASAVARNHKMKITAN